MKDCKVNILGTEYSLIFKTDEEVAADEECEIGHLGGYCDAFAKTIVMAKLNTSNRLEELRNISIKSNLRHEIIHAFLIESGLMYNTLSAEAWAINEEMVDWWANQSPKIFKVFQELDIL